MAIRDQEKIGPNFLATTESDNDDNDNDNNNKKKRRVGLASASPATISRVLEARLLALKEMKEEANGLPLKMGLATLSKAARKKISKMGTAAMKENYDVSYYSTIGKKGGKAVLERYSVTYFSDIAKKKRKKGNKRKKERAEKNKRQ
jgi:hypothetical protein